MSLCRKSPAFQTSTFLICPSCAVAPRWPVSRSGGGWGTSSRPTRERPAVRDVGRPGLLPARHASWAWNSIIASSARKFEAG